MSEEKKDGGLNVKLLLGALVLAGIFMLEIIPALQGDAAAGEVVELPEPPQPGEDANPDALLIVEYSDFKCPYCKRGADTVSQLKEKYGDQIHVEFRQFPLSFHRGADRAAEASECARDQGMFWEYHDALFTAYHDERRDIGDSEVLRTLANEVGLNYRQFTGCIDSREKKPKVQADIAQAKSYGITGTPSFVINGKLLKGAQPIEVFDKIISGEIS